MYAHLPLLIPLIYLLAAIPYASLGLYAWHHRPAAAVIPFAWMMLGMAVWSSLYSLEILFPDVNTKLRLDNIEYFGVVSIPVFFLIFALEYNGKGHLLTLRNKGLLWCIPLVILILVSTNEFHGLMWKSATVEQSYGLFLLNIQPQFFFWVNVIYSYILLLAGSLILIMEFVQRPGIYRFQASLVIIGLIFPWIGNVIYLTGLGPIQNLDLTPLFFVPTSIALGWAIARYRLLDVIPLEHAAVLQNMRDGVIVLDSQERVLYINPIAGLLMGRTEAETIGQPLTRVSASYADAITPELTGQEKQFEVTFNGSGSASIYDVTISPMPAPQKSIAPQNSNYVVIFHDITQRKEMETILSRREAMMEAVSLAADQFLKESLWEHNIPDILKRIGQAADVSRVYVVMNYTDEKGVLHSSLCYEWAAPGIKSRLDDLNMQHIPLQQAGFSRWEDTLKKGQSVHGLLREFPESEKDFLKKYRIKSMAVMPIFVDKLWWGFVGFDDCRRERKWTVVELEALHIAANIFGSTETRARAEQKLLRRQRTLNMLHEIVLLSLQAPNLQSMAHNLVERMKELLNADGCYLALWDEPYRQAIPLAGSGKEIDAFLAFRPAPGEKTLTASALQIGHTLVIGDTQNHQLTDYKFPPNFSAKSIIVFPLIAGNNRLGAIILTSNRYRQLLPEEISIGELASSLIAISLEKFQAMEHARRRAEESETLRKAGAAVTETLHHEEAVVRILEQLSQVISYDSASVQILDGNELEIIGGRGWENVSDVIGIRFPIPGDNPNTIVIQTGKPYLLLEADKAYKAFNNPPHNHILSWLGVPLMVQDRVIGLLAVDSSKPHHFTNENINLVAAFAEQVAIALENARLFTQTQTLAITDALTGVYNRRGLIELGEFEFARARRISRPFSVIMIDIDHFKRVNDHHGHAAGDEVLRALAQRCRVGSRTVDLVGRYGGEEFLILLPESSLESARLVAERLRQSLHNESIQTEAGPMRITISIGVAEMTDTDNLKSLIARADGALYEAKNSGRNRVVLAK